MNSQLLHHFFNHIPSIGLVIGLALLVYAVMIKSAPVVRAALLTLTVAALAVWPANATGEGAEELVEHLPGVSEAQIHRHEEAAESAFLITIAVGALALVGLVAHWRKWSFAPSLNWVVLLAGAVAVWFLVGASHEGGLIRHPEMGTAAVQETPGAGPGTGTETGEEEEEGE